MKRFITTFVLAATFSFSQLASAESLILPSNEKFVATVADTSPDVDSRLDGHDAKIKNLEMKQTVDRDYIEIAQYTADEARVTADKAVVIATDAKTVADGAKVVADDAKGIATDANDKATKAQAKADNNETRIEGLDKETARLEDVKADKKDLDDLTGKVGDNTTKIDNIKTDVTNVQNDLSVTNGKVTENTIKIDSISSDVSNVQNQVTNIDGRVDQVTNVAVDASNKADHAINVSNNNTTAINNERVERVQGETRVLNESKSYTDNKFSSLKSTIDDNRKKASAGIAGVAAMANIPTISANGRFSLGMGIGSYDSQQSIAVGFQGRVSERVTTKVSFSSTNHGDAVFGAGAALEW